MRRASYTPLPTQAPSEPLIVVEESGGGEEEESPSREPSPPMMMNPDSPLLNPCLLSPYRDLRKRSLPTPHCTSGITASQVRRLSEHGVDSAGTAVREAAFLATLSQAPVPAPGGRRHSVVTISRAPPPSILFGRGRRESIAAFPTSGMQARVLQSRRDSTSSVPRPPATSSTTGSNFNLQLDIMDDIAEIKAARKVRLKMWRTPSRERVCEVQPLDGAAGPSGTSVTPTRYHQQPGVPGRSPVGEGAGRRYSDFVTTGSLQPPPIPPRRRASELPPSSVAKAKQEDSGIVCSNTDLISILSSLASSAQEINVPREGSTPSTPKLKEDKKKSFLPSASSSTEQKRNRLKNLRSNSFDVSMLLGTGNKSQYSHAFRSGSVGPASWFVKRHQPKKAGEPFRQAKVAEPMVESGGRKELRRRSSSSCKSSPTSSIANIVWDEHVGAIVDAQKLGSAIEVFLTQRGGSSKDSPKSGPQQGMSSSPTSKTSAIKSGVSSWFSSMKNKEGDESKESCESSICSTLKDLFVK
ncbi:uncharacterized protein [Anabrus simplex]|uniref:uncharacterized protein n=1 Tax=Anabrus simplex TaxID=316456 RepID=UPI0035A370A8